jgi:hypothetical protein
MGSNLPSGKINCGNVVKQGSFLTSPAMEFIFSWTSIQAKLLINFTPVEDWWKSYRKRVTPHTNG